MNMGISTQEAATFIMCLVEDNLPVAMLYMYMHVLDKPHPTISYLQSLHFYECLWCVPYCLFIVTRNAFTVGVLYNYILQLQLLSILVEMTKLCL